MWKKLLAGAVSASAGSALANPFDLVKFRLQVDTATVHCFGDTMVDGVVRVQQ